MDDNRSKPEPDDGLRRTAAGRRPYKRPSLTEYGPVAKLTQNMAAGSFSDGMGRRMMMGCL